MGELGMNPSFKLPDMSELIGFFKIFNSQLGNENHLEIYQ